MKYAIIKRKILMLKLILKKSKLTLNKNLNNLEINILKRKNNYFNFYQNYKELIIVKIDFRCIMI